MKVLIMMFLLTSCAIAPMKRKFKYSHPRVRQMKRCILEFIEVGVTPMDALNICDRVISRRK